MRWKSLIDALRLKLIAEKKGPREAFDKYDMDKDGLLNKSELRSMFASLGATSSFSSGDLATIIAKCSAASGRRDQQVTVRAPTQSQPSGRICTFSRDRPDASPDACSAVTRHGSVTTAGAHSLHPRWRVISARVNHGRYDIFTTYRIHMHVVLTDKGRPKFVEPSRSLTLVLTISTRVRAEFRPRYRNENCTWMAQIVGQL